MHVYQCSWNIYCTHEYVLDEFICVCSQAGDWVVYIHSQLNNMFQNVFITTMFTLLATE
jgi:hypothetical protein